MACAVFPLLACLVIASVTASPCGESLPTIAYVEDCPRTQSDWLKRSDLKRCFDMHPNCTTEKNKFSYHCLLNEWGNTTLEVCAIEVQITGKLCGEFNSGGKLIQGNPSISCTTCPNPYPSGNAYLYSDCYDVVKRNSVKNQAKSKEEDQSLSLSTLIGVVVGGLALIVTLGVIVVILLVRFYQQHLRERQEEQEKEKKNGPRDTENPDGNVDKDHATTQAITENAQDVANDTENPDGNVDKGHATIHANIENTQDKQDEDIVKGKEAENIPLVPRNN